MGAIGDAIIFLRGGLPHRSDDVTVDGRNRFKPFAAPDPFAAKATGVIVIDSEFSHDLMHSMFPDTNQ